MACRHTATHLSLPNRQRHSVLSAYPMSDRESYRYMLVEFLGSAFVAFAGCGAVVASGLYVHQVQFASVLPVRALVNALAQGAALAAVFATFAFLDQTVAHPDDRGDERFARLRSGDTVMYRVRGDVATRTGTVVRVADAERARHLIELSGGRAASRLEKWYAAWSEQLWGQWAYPFPLPRAYVLRDAMTRTTREVPRAHIREPPRPDDEVEVTAAGGVGELAVVRRMASPTEWEVRLPGSGALATLDAWAIMASPHRVFRLAQCNPLATYALCLLGELHPHFALMLVLAQVFGCFCGIGLVACGIPDARAFQLGVIDAAAAINGNTAAVATTTAAPVDLLVTPGGGAVFVTSALQCFVYVLAFLVVAVDAKGKTRTPVRDHANTVLSVSNKAFLLGAAHLVAGGMLGAAGVRGGGVNPAYALAAGALAGTLRFQATAWLAGVLGAFAACAAFVAMAPMRYARQVTAGCCCHSHRNRRRRLERRRRQEQRQLDQGKGKGKAGGDVPPGAGHDDGGGGGGDGPLFADAGDTEGTEAEEFGKLLLRRELLSFLAVQLLVGGLVAVVSTCRCCDCSGGGGGSGPKQRRYNGGRVGGGGAADED